MGIYRLKYDAYHTIPYYCRKLKSHNFCSIDTEKAISKSNGLSSMFNALEFNAHARDCLFNRKHWRTEDLLILNSIKEYDDCISPITKTGLEPRADHYFC